MKTKNIENQAEETTQENEVVPTGKSLNENFLSELQAPIWSVVSFEKIMHSSVNYDEAMQKMQELNEQKVSGLCIITDDAAQRLAG